MDTERTTRQRIADALRSAPATPSELSAEFGVSVGTVLRDVEHVARTLDGTDEELLARPPRCRECGFEDFDDPLNVPSRCPQCRNEGIDEPAFKIS